MEIKHTPGPWTNHGRIPQPGLPHSSIGAKTLIARVYSEAFGDTENEAANARLIAAAPELLEALTYLRDCIESGKEPGMGIVHAAITKATGVQA